MSAAPRKPVMVVSHGFQAHYELGFVNGLAQNGHDVVLLGSDRTISRRLHRRVELRNIRGSQDPRRPLWRKVLGMLRYHLQLLAEAVRARGAPVVCIGMQNPEWWVGVLEGLWIAAWAGSYAVVVHNVLPHEKHTPAMRRVYGVIYRIPRWLLVHTEAGRDALLRDFGVAAARVLLVPHGLNDAVERAPLSREAAKEALGFSASDRTVLLFGRTGYYKGADLLLDALERLPDLRLIMAGKAGGDPHSIEVCARTGALVGQGRAWWRDAYIGDDEIGPIFAASDVAVLPYRHIDQSGVLLLALTLGVPVLTTPVGGFAELVDDHNGAFIATPTVDAVVRALEDFFARPRPSAEAVRASVAHLSWKRTLHAYVSRIGAAPRADADHAPSPRAAAVTRRETVTDDRD